MEKFPSIGIGAETAPEPEAIRTELSRLHRMKDKLAGALSMLAVAGGVAAEAPREVRAAEIEPQMSWTEGVHEMRQEAMHSSGEVEAIFTLTKSGSEWGVHATSDTTKMRSTGLHTVLSALPATDDLERVCVLHSHPFDPDGLRDKGGTTGAFMQDVIETYDNGGTIYLTDPPSAVDTRLKNFEIRDAAAEKYQIDSSQIVFGVTDAAGIWYFDRIQEADFTTLPEVQEITGRLVTLRQQWQAHLDAKLGNLTDDERRRLSAQGEAVGINELIDKLHRADPIASEVFTDGETARLLGSINAIRAEVRQYREVTKGYTADLYTASVKMQLDPSPANRQHYQDQIGRVINSYALNSVKARFVPYDTLDAEPPCAGARWGEHP